MTDLVGDAIAIERLEKHLDDRDEMIGRKNEEIVRLREALEGRTLSCSQCNTSAAEIVRLQTALARTHCMCLGRGEPLCVRCAALSESTKGNDDE